MHISKKIATPHSKNSRPTSFGRLFFIRKAICHKIHKIHINPNKPFAITYQLAYGQLNRNSC